jgi:hypothetical protein
MDVNVILAMMVFISLIANVFHVIQLVKHAQYQPKIVQIVKMAII